MSTREYDLIILGGGIGGYTAAIRASQAGKTVALVERDKLGGTCLHRGCIPSKSLLRSAEVLATLKEGEQYGVKAEGISLDFGRVMERKDEVIDKLFQGVQFLMKKHKIDVYQGEGRVIGPSIFSPRSGAIAIQSEDEDTPTLIGKNTLLATGSRPRSLPGLEFDGDRILSSDDILRLEQLPASMIIIGGGVIGVEWASLLNDFGVKVTLIEAAEHLLPQEDRDISKEMQRLLEQRGVQVYVQAQVDPESVKPSEQQVSMMFTQQEEHQSATAERCLVSIGRVANVEGIGLENTDVTIKNGTVVVNANLQTNESHIYAIGDMIGGLQLAHKASFEAIQAVDHMLGRALSPSVRTRIPRCIYTRPEVAAIGLTEQEATEQGFKCKIGRVPFSAIGKAHVYGQTDGFVKVIADAQTDDLLGVHIIGPQATELISEVGVAQILEAAPKT